MKHLASIIGAVALCGAALSSNGALAASHREAPLIANDPAADNTDFYMFRSWTNPNNVVFILNTLPAQEPGAGPNYFNFGDDVLYRINIDTNADGDEDLSYEIRFSTEVRGPLKNLQLPLSYVALAADHRTRRGRVGGPDPAPALHGDAGPGSRSRGSGHAHDVRRAVQRGSADDARL